MHFMFSSLYFLLLGVHWFVAFDVQMTYMEFSKPLTNDCFTSAEPGKHSTSSPENDVFFTYEIPFYPFFQNSKPAWKLQHGCFHG